jgi:hypothetical protein
MISIAKKSGRLVEVRAKSPLTMEELVKFKTEVVDLLKTLDQKFVSCVDLRQLRLLQQPQTEVIEKILLNNNPMFERSAYLLSEGRSGLAMQFERLIQEAKNPSRRAFHNEDEVVSWLRETMTMSEVIRLKVFLGEPKLEQSFK